MAEPKRSTFPRELAELTFEEAEALRAQGAVALLPVGATEAHGPHLPLSTDVIISKAAAKAAVTQLRSEGFAAVVLPPIAYAVTEFAAEFSGTISISKETAVALMRDVMVGAHRAGFRAVVACNAHLEPGNLEAIAEAVKLANEAGTPAAFPNITRKPHALQLGEEFKSGACHAGSYETSLVMAASPFLVKREVALGLEPNPSSLSVAIREGKGTFEEAGGPRAYFGFPADASETEGHHLYGVLAEIFASEARALLAKLDAEG